MTLDHSRLASAPHTHTRTHAAYIHCLWTLSTASLFSLLDQTRAAYLLLLYWHKWSTRLTWSHLFWSQLIATLELRVSLRLSWCDELWALSAAQAAGIGACSLGLACRQGSCSASCADAHALSLRPHALSLRPHALSLRPMLILCLQRVLPEMLWREPL
jgi:hypothetical protein